MISEPRLVILNRHGSNLLAVQYNSSLLTLLRLFLSSRAALIAENLFLRKQVALFKERKVKPHPASRQTRLSMLVLTQFFNWREALAIVKPETVIKWHRNVFRMFWKWKSRKRGRPPIPPHLRDLIRQMDQDNPTWGEERITHELALKLSILISPATVRKYLKADRPFGGSKDQKWSTFVRNHAQGIVACDFLMTVTTSFRILYVFVAWRSARGAFCTPT